MSFVRINRRPVRTKKSSALRKEWVSTVTDLSMHKPTSEELSRRHEMHMSRNKAAAQWELREKTLKTRKSRSASPPGLDRTRLRLFREMFSDQYQLHDVLARSDRALAAVKDLFGDAPCRQTGFPSVTMAPGCESDSELPVLQKPDPPTQLSLLSQSMMDQEALNEFDDSVGEHGVQDQDDLVSFNTEIPRPKRKTCKAKPPGWTTSQRRQQQNLPQTPCNAAMSSEEQAALNATVAVQRLKSRQYQPDADQSTTLVTQVLNPAPSHLGGKNRPGRNTRGHFSEAQLNGSGFSSGSANHSSLEMLQDMLGQVESELACLDPQGNLDDSEQPELQCGRGLTGFSVALVGALGRIAAHLRRKEEEAEKEQQVRKRMEEELKEHRNLIDALTAECLALREESAALQANLRGRLTELEQRLDMVILTMGEMGNDGNAQGEFDEEEHVPGGHLKPGPTEEDQAAAVMLSPPRQRDAKAPPAARTRSLHFEGSNTPSSGSAAESDFSCSPSSFASLPESVLPRTVQLLTQPPQDVLLDQIAVLTNQNAAMRNQLGQYRTSPTGASLTKELSADGHTAPPAGYQTTQQCVRADDSSVKLMEDRLQELNRQSSAARTKLLELIEQQKNSSSHSASPAISPIPTHSTSPPAVAVRRTPEVFVSVPERDRPSHTSSNDRS
ncbi:spindle and centriole-associated protein 1 isoform X2 [Trichomycterus rosablanca]